MQRRKAPKSERYIFEDSPWRQDLTQRDLADLLGCRKERLEALIEHKEEYVVRRTITIGQKLRNLAYPVRKLRTIHERLKYHLNKIKHPEYLLSPRKGRSQRDNALIHVGQNQFLKLDIRQFYPSTSSEHIFRWAHHVAGLRPDVAGLFTHLVTIDDKMPFGSPLSPVLATHVHRPMFDAIHAACRRRGLRMSLWVDDLAISGRFVPGTLVEEIREIIRCNGFQSHKIQFRTGARPVLITGVPIVTGEIFAPRALHDRIRSCYSDLARCDSDADRCQLIDRLLSQLGSYRYMVGASTPSGRKAADHMNTLRQRRLMLRPVYVTRPVSEAAVLQLAIVPSDELPFDL
jgi:hypothetical protein